MLAAWVGDNWGQLWEEHWVLRDEEEVKEEGLVMKEQSRVEQSTNDKVECQSDPQRMGQQQGLDPAGSWFWILALPWAHHSISLDSVLSSVKWR